MNRLLFPIIKELEDLARSHPNPAIRVEVLRLIDSLNGVEDSALLATMHEFYKLREQLREEREVEKLIGKKTHRIEPAEINSLPEIPASKFSPNLFQDVLDEIEVDEMMLTHKRWNVTIGEA